MSEWTYRDAGSRHDVAALDTDGGGGGLNESRASFFNSPER